MKRLFIAMALPEKIKEEMLHSFTHRNFPNVRWIAGKNQHITVLFMGDTPGERLGNILQESALICSSTSPFELKLDCFRVIFKNKMPVMLWAQFEQSSAFDDLCLQFRKKFSSDEKHEPVPHVTMARIRQLKQLPFSIPLSPKISLKADKIELWQSHLLQAGADYECIQSWQLR